MVRFCGDTLLGGPEIEEEDSHGGGFTAVIFTKGFFVRNPQLQYFGGEVGVFKGLDPEKWSYFEALGYAKDLDKELESKTESVKLWWKPSNMALDKCLKKLTLDIHASELANFAVENQEDVDIYVDYNSSSDSGNEESPRCVEGVELYGAGASKSDYKGKGIAAEGEDVSENESSDSDYIANEVHFDDSEEERMFAEDDGFLELELVAGAGVVENDVHQGQGLNVDQHDDNGGLEDGYVTDDLDSASDADNVEGVKPIYPRFKAEDLNKDFKFTVGMEFCSLKQFKEAILELNVLNGRDIKFKKNDKNRCRVICKSFDTCNYLVFVSRVVRTHTFRVKTLVQKHTCGRVFDNKSATTGWVTKVLVEKMKNLETFNINQVVGEIRTMFSTGITPSRAFKARKMARKIVDGDIEKQYSMIWSYSAEIQRACSGVIP